MCCRFTVTFIYMAHYKWIDHEDNINTILVTDVQSLLSNTYSIPVCVRVCACVVHTCASALPI